MRDPHCSGLVSRAHRCPRAASRHPRERAPSTANDSVARDHYFCVPTARRRESASQSDAGRGRRERALIEMNGRQRDGLRVQDDRAGDGDGKRFKNDSRIR
jgi:hypothetical protein